jgi:glycosyltransferase involved in cell wall biosynthesis
MCKIDPANEAPGLVSVIIPCYNDGIFLADAVRSVLNSTYENIQVIIVDDGSTDNTSEVAGTMVEESSKVKYLFHENRGLAASRNRGIEYAAGKFILPLDADDKISPEYIAEAVKILQAKEDVRVVYCNAWFFGKKQGEWKLKPFTRKILPRENVIFCSAMYRKEDWVKAGGYSDEMKSGWEDWEFWISLLKNGGEVYKLPLTGFFYRIKENSMRKEMTKRKKSENIKFMNLKHKDFFYKELGGPLRTHRGLSRFINRFSFLAR